MKILLFLLFINWGSIACLQAQSSYYISQDYEKKGVTEYLHFYIEHVGYWTNRDKKRVELKNISLDWSNPKTGYQFVMSFPESNLKYHLLQKEQEVICTHPDGRKQVFTRLPVLYISKDHERKGITEFLEIAPNGKSVWYYTNLKRNRKIKLQLLSKDGHYKGKVKFPGQKAIYELRREPACDGDIYCIDANKRVQTFKFYRWNE